MPPRCACGPTFGRGRPEVTAHSWIRLRPSSRKRTSSNCKLDLRSCMPVTELRVGRLLFQEAVQPVESAFEHEAEDGAMEALFHVRCGIHSGAY